MVGDAPKPRRPADMTEAELEALPVGPFIRRERPLTAEDRAKGMHGRSVVWMEEQRVLVGHVLGTDIIFWRDGDGQAWTFGQWADGTWFKEPSFL